MRFCFVVKFVSFFFLIDTCLAQQKQLPNEKKNIVVDNIQRSFIIHQPVAFKASSKIPLVFVLHGGGEDAKAMMAFSHFNQLADRDTFLIIYPNAYQNHWSDGRFAEGPPYHKGKKIDDVKFINSIIDLAIGEYNIDTAKIFLTGIANGAIMCHKIACQLSNRICAIAPVLGSMSELMSLQCKPVRGVSVLAINGTDDRLIPINGGEIEFDDNKYGRITSVSGSIKFWAAYNDTTVKKPIMVKQKDLDKSDGTSVYRHHYYNGTYDTEVVLYLIKGGGHSWPGAKQFHPEEIAGRKSKELDATELIWDFFKSHHR